MKKIWSVILSVVFICAACVPFSVQAVGRTGSMLTFKCYNCDNVIRPAIFMESNFYCILDLPPYLAIKDSDMDTVCFIAYEEFYCSTCESESVVGFQLNSTGDYFCANSYSSFLIDPYVSDVLYVIFEKSVQGIITGDPVPNATGYELYERTGNVFMLKARSSTLEFDLTTLNLSSGDHYFVVIATAPGYEESKESNEVVYTVK